MRPARKSIDKIFLYSMTALAVVSISILAGLFISYLYREFGKESQELRREYIDNQKVIIRNEVETVIDYIDYMKSLTEQRLMTEIQNRTREAYAVAMHIYTENKEKKSRPEIENLIKEALRPIRFNNGRGYYFAGNFAGVEQLFADKPEMEGRNLIDMRDTSGQYVIKDIIQIAKEHNEGYYRYLWTKPNLMGANFPKIAFIKHFEPFDWFIGTGEYLDDMEADIKTEILERIGKIRFGKDGYIFVMDYSGTVLMNDVQRNLIDKNLWEMTDPNGVKVIQEERKAVRNPEGGFVDYVWNKPSESKPAPKISFLKGIEDWEWMVGAGLYVDEIENVIATKRASLADDVTIQITKIIILLFFLLIAIYATAQFISRRIRKGFETFALFFQKSALESTKIEKHDLYFSEFEDLAATANRMVDQREQAEKAVRESEQRFRMILENLPVAVFVHDLEGRHLIVNDRACQYTGYSRKELLRASVKDTDPMSISRDDRTRLWHALREGERVSLESSLRRKDGTEFPVEIHLNGFNLDGRPIILALAIDITEQQQAKVALSKSEQRFRDLFNAISDIIYTQDLEGRFISVNPALCNAFGYTEEELIGRQASDFMKPEMATAYKNVYLEKIKQEGYCQGTASYFTKDGSKIYLEYRSSLVRPTDGEPYISGTGRDVTDKFASLRTVANLQKQLAQAQKMESIGTLAGGIAHDFNNILFPMFGYLEMMLQDIPADSPTHRHLIEVFGAARRARDLIKQILTFSRQTEQELKPVKIQTIVAETMLLLRSTIPSTIAIRTDLSQACGLVLADPTQIHQIVLNLCTNAYHAMQETGGSLTVTLAPHEVTVADAKDWTIAAGTYVRLEISDTGTGIEPSVLGRIFDPYFTTKSKDKGTGLGLAVTHGIIRSHGGHITVHSVPGKGTTFTVYLPVIKHQEYAPRKADAETPIQGGNERILIVDDQEMIVQMEREMIERLGYHATARASSTEALEAFRAKPEAYDLVITDMTMPNMTGDKLAEELHRIRDDIPVILCTGFSEIISPENANVLGIKGFLMKPVVLKDLAGMIRKVLDSGRSKECSKIRNTNIEIRNKS
jgi:PAS domain S-box-containing protein